MPLVQELRLSPVRTVMDAQRAFDELQNYINRKLLSVVNAPTKETAVTSDCEAKPEDRLLYAIAAPLTVTLPTAVGREVPIDVKLLVPGVLTIKPLPGQLIDGVDEVLISIQYGSLTFYPHDGNWYII